MDKTWWRWGLTVASLAVFVGVYSGISGWPYAIGFSLLLLAHEFGHTLGGVSQQVQITSPIFIPLVGAFVNLKEKPPSAFQEAVIACCGPLAGLAVAVGLWLGSLVFSSEVLRELGRAGFAVHVLNLLPIFPLDGGRMVAGVSWRVGRLAAVVAFFLAVWAGADMLAAMLFGIWMTSKRDESPGYYDVSAKLRGWLGALYLWLLLISLVGYRSLGGEWAGIFYLGSAPNRIMGFWEAALFFGVIVLIVTGATAFVRWSNRCAEEAANRPRPQEQVGVEEH